MKTRVVLVAAGALLIAYAMIGALTDDQADPIGMAVFLVAVLVGHDLVWMPAVLAAVALTPMVSAAIRKRFARPRRRDGE
jgi:hypothetical protein